jgi:hypothetical protein
VIHGAFWPSVKHRIEDLYDKRVVVYPNMSPLKNRARQREYIWAIEDYETKRVLAIATEVPLVGAPLTWLSNRAVLGRIPPGQLVLVNAFPVGRSEQSSPMHSCICTSDGEIWSSGGRYPPVKYRAESGMVV